MNIESIFDETISLLNDTKSKQLPSIIKTANLLVYAFKKGKKVLICGNGGSAADAQHIAAEFINRYKIERQPLPAIALTTDSSVLTSIGNDYSYNDVFAKQVRALANEGDIIIGISTSGKSKNVLKAFEMAKIKGATNVGLSGNFSEEMSKLCDSYIFINSKNTPRVQEVLLVVEHILCEIVDENWKNEQI